jgi:PAS domain-containing protein
MDTSVLTLETMLSLLNGLDAMVYATDPATNKLIFVNEPIKRHFGIEGDVTGQFCYDVFHLGIDGRCDECACHKLDKNPDMVVEWEELNSKTKRLYRNTDRYIDWANGKKIHVNQSVDITNHLRRENIMQAVNQAAALLLSTENKGDIEKPLKTGMELVGLSVDADRVHIWRSEMSDGELHYVFEYGWFNELGEKTKANFVNYKFPHAMMPMWKKKFLRGEPVSGVVSKLSKEEQTFLNRYSTKSVVIIPLFIKDEFWGFFGLEDCKEEREFTCEEINILKSVSLMMANAISQNILLNEMNEAHKRSLLMLDTAPICAQIWTRDLSTIDCNQAGVKMYGFKDKQEYVDRFLSSCSPEFQHEILDPGF